MKSKFFCLQLHSVYGSLDYRNGDPNDVRDRNFTSIVISSVAGNRVVNFLTTDEIE